MSSLRNQLVSITRRLSSFVVGNVARDAIEHRGRAIYLEVIALSRGGGEGDASKGRVGETQTMISRSLCGSRGTRPSTRTFLHAGHADPCKICLSLFTVHPAPCNYLSALATGFARELYIYMYETEVQFEIYIYREITEIVIHGTVCWFYKREERNEAKFRVVSFFLSFSFFLCLSLTSMSFLHAWREGSRARPTIMLIDVTGDTYLSFGTRARVHTVYFLREKYNKRIFVVVKRV